MDRRVYLLAATRCINTMGFSIVMPFMALYLVEERGALAKLVGLIYLVAGVAAAGSQGIAGELADRFGRRRLMVAALSLRALNMIALGLAVNAHAGIHAIGALIVSNGVLRGGFEPAAGAAVTDLTAPDQRVAAFGLQRIGINLGWSIGPALGGALAHQGYGTVFFFAAPTLLVAAAFASRVPDGGRVRAERGQASGDGRPSRTFLVCLLLVLCGAALTTQIFATLSTYLGAELGWSQGKIGLLYTINGALVVLLQVPAVSLIRRGGARVVLVVGPSLFTVAYLGMGLGDSFAWIACCIAVITAGEVLFAPALSDLAVQLGDPARHGRSFGLFGLMQTLGISVGPLLGGAVFDALRDHHQAMWSVIAGMMALVALGWRAFSVTLSRRSSSPWTP